LRWTVCVVAAGLITASGCGASRPAPRAEPRDPRKEAAAAFLAGPGKCPAPAMRAPSDDPELLSFDLDVGELLSPRSLPRTYEPLLRALGQVRAQLELCVGARPEAEVVVGPGREVTSVDADRDASARATADCVKAALGSVPAWSSPRATALLLSRSVDFPGKALSADMLGSVIGQHAGEVKACYDAALGALGPFEVQLMVVLQIRADGSVSGVHVSANSAVDPLRCCIARAAAEWAFPPANISTEVHVPFELRPAAQ
jgi:hypothetical protein